MMLSTEAQVLRTLRRGTYTMGDLYVLIGGSADISRDGGHDPVPGHPGDKRWKHRLRGALQTARRNGTAHRVPAGWAIEGTWERPTRLVLVLQGAMPLDFELRLQSAVDLLRSLGAAADLVLCDPPYGLGRGDGRHFDDGHGYRRDHSRVAGGYQDVDPAAYADFTAGWVSAAAGALRQGGQLAAVMGPQRAAVVQGAAEDAGLTWVASIAARREFALYTRSRPSPAHWTIVLMVKGALRHPRRVFNPPADLPPARSGAAYPLDFWPDNGRADRRGAYRYATALPLRLVLRLVRMLTNAGDHVVDPCAGSGTTGVACYLTGRAFTGGDVNEAAIRFAAARILAEHVAPDDAQPGLFPRPA